MKDLKEICESLPGWAHYLVFGFLFLWEYWLGKTKKLWASSTLELFLTWFEKPKSKETSMNLGTGVTAEYKEGKIVLSADVGSLFIPVLADLKAKIESGAIDPIAGTDLDKELLLKVIEFLQAEVSK